LTRLGLKASFSCMPESCFKTWSLAPKVFVNHYSFSYHIITRNYFSTKLIFWFCARMFCFNKKHHLRLVSVSCGCPFEADQLRFMGVMAAPYQPELVVSIWSDTYFIQFSLTVSNYNLKGYVRSIVCVVHIVIAFNFSIIVISGRHWPVPPRRRAVRRGGRQDRDHHAESSPVQDPRLVPQQAEGHQGWWVVQALFLQVKEVEKQLIPTFKAYTKILVLIKNDGFHLN